MPTNPIAPGEGETGRAELARGFPAGFAWGAAAASYQIEGAFEEDGKGLSVWDGFCRRPGAVYRGHTGDVACDHYHRYRDDVALMREIGLQAYRFSVSWPRVMPEGTGAVNPKGLGFYDRLVDELLAGGIEPWVTLFHWDYPQALFRRGGWLNPDSPRWFADYARVVVERLSDRVAHWMTVNETQVFIGEGHLAGVHAPGLCLPFDQVLRAAHHALMAHGLAVRTIRAHASRRPVVGWAQVGRAYFPETESSEDIEAARRATGGVIEKDLWNNTWWADPVLRGSYPEDGLRLFGKDVPAFTDGEMRTIRQPLDFYGLNIYEGRPVRAGPGGDPVVLELPPGYPHTHFVWNVTPDVLYWCPKFIHERYGTPIVITENGMTGTDWVALDGQVHDPQRIDYLHRYLRALRRASHDGVDVRGYFAWSILDNFEWAEGYKHRFGLVHVDYASQARTPKDSAWWYRDVIRANGANL